MSSINIEHVSDTALWVAHYRALESERPDALFKDPLAKVLVGERGKQIAERMRDTSKYTSWGLTIRTCIIDRYIEKLVAGGVDMVVNLGAGLDTRPYRMQLPPSLRWIEVDYPHMIDHKETHLAREQPRCQLERIRLDLSEREKRVSLLSQLADRGKKILVITEGVIPYLSEDQVGELADDLRALEPVKFWIGEYFSPATYRYLRSPKRRRQMKNAPFLFFPADWFGFFRSHGWVPLETKYLAEESRKLGRSIPAPWFAFIFRIFRVNKVRQAFQRSTAYVIFEKG